MKTVLPFVSALALSSPAFAMDNIVYRNPIPASFAYSSNGNSIPLTETDLVYGRLFSDIDISDYSIGTLLNVAKEEVAPTPDYTDASRFNIVLSDSQHNDILRDGEDRIAMQIEATVLVSNSLSHKFAISEESISNDDEAFGYLFSDFDISAYDSENEPEPTVDVTIDQHTPPNRPTDAKANMTLAYREEEFPANNINITLAAAEDTVAVEDEIVEVENVAETDLVDEDEFALANVVTDDELEEVRGAAGTTIAGDTLFISGDTIGAAVSTAVSVNNSVQGGYTGDNVISGDAFGASSGVSFVVQNTGNNAAINAAMVINLSIKQ